MVMSMEAYGILHGVSVGQLDCIGCHLLKFMVSRRYLLKRMTLELKEIHTLLMCKFRSSSRA